ncbi:MAG TPA: protein kinase [Vicinamibacterales bacterium]|nr:protein kinase [Vicinamibacterales bacterium]
MLPDTVGPYRLLEPLGAGTLGTLHRARDLERGRSVALRVLRSDRGDDPADPEAVLGAARKIAALSHPAIAAIYDWGHADAVAFIASEFVPGDQLSAMVHGAPLHPRQALEFAAQMADGLAAAHAHDLRHDALTAAAVRITPKGAAKILDVGMFAWTAARARAPQDDRAGVGAVLFEMLTGRPLRPGWPAEFRAREIPVGVQPVLRKLASVDAGEQYGSMAFAAAALRAAASAVAVSADERPDAAAPMTPADGRPWGTVLVAALALVLVAAIAWWLTN